MRVNTICLIGDSTSSQAILSLGEAVEVVGEGEGLGDSR